MLAAGLGSVVLHKALTVVLPVPTDPQAGEGPSSQGLLCGFFGWTVGGLWIRRLPL